MRQFESEHYIFHFNEGSEAEADIGSIAACQEACYRYICAVLKISPSFKIDYYLCNSPMEVGRLYGDDEPCNGFAVMPNRIYAVYNAQIQCIGFHEDAHILSYTIHRPNCPAVREGLAMYFDRKWWGIQNMDWTCYYRKHGQYLSVESLLDKEFFFDADCSITYPIMGAFTDYLITVYGMESYLRFYSQEEIHLGMEAVYQKTPAQMDQEFLSYIGLFSLDTVLESRIEALLEHQRTE